MATPYLQKRVGEVTSTQDSARAAFTELPVLVVASGQSEGRGRSGSTWLTAPRALAASLAMAIPDNEARPLSLVAGVAARRVLETVELKWPNDLVVPAGKVGGILVEMGEGRVVVGLGVNLWWPDPPAGFAALFDQDPGEELHAQLGALWGAELLAILDADDWPHDEYAAHCTTLGSEIVWEPSGSGRALGVAEDGGLIVETASGRTTLRSGAVTHVRAQP